MSNHRTPGPLGSNPHGRSPFKGLNPGPGGFAPANPTGLDGGKATGEEDEILRPVDVPPGFKPERCLSEKPTAESLGDTDDFTAGGPTVVCDGNGGYRVDMAGKEGLLYGNCLRIHEESHIEDLKAICPMAAKTRKTARPTQLTAAVVRPSKMPTHIARGASSPSARPTSASLNVSGNCISRWRKVRFTKASCARGSNR